MRATEREVGAEQRYERETAAAEILALRAILRTPIEIAQPVSVPEIRDRILAFYACCQRTGAANLWDRELTHDEIEPRPRCR